MIDWLIDMSDCISLSSAMTYRDQTHLPYTKEGLPVPGLQLFSDA